MFKKKIILILVACALTVSNFELIGENTRTNRPQARLGASPQPRPQFRHEARPQAKVGVECVSIITSLVFLPLIIYKLAQLSINGSSQAVLFENGTSTGLTCMGRECSEKFDIKEGLPYLKPNPQPNPDVIKSAEDIRQEMVADMASRVRKLELDGQKARQKAADQINKRSLKRKK